MMEFLHFQQLPERIKLAVQGGATRFRCPRCHGGGSQEVTCSWQPPGGESITGSLFCFRASCGWTARVLVGEGEHIVHVKGDVHEARVLSLPTAPLSGEIETRLRDYHIVAPTTLAKRGWCVLEKDPQTLVMPVYGPDSSLRGHTTRTFAKPKQCSSYKATAKPWLDWFPNDGGYGPGKLVNNSLYIVEDQISALRLRVNGYHAVALLGTNMNLQKAKEIADFCHQHHTPATLALDPDATDKAFNYAKKWRYLFPQGQLGVLALQSDVKDLDPADFIKTFSKRIPLLNSGSRADE